MAIAPGLLTDVKRLNFDDVLYRAMGNLVRPARAFVARDTNRNGIFRDNCHFWVPDVSNSAV